MVNSNEKSRVCPYGDVVFGVSDPANMTGQLAQSDAAFSGIIAQSGTWYQIICIFDKSLQSVYINGQLKITKSRVFNNLPVTNSQLVFGSWWKNDPFFFNGALDEVRIYNRPLNSGEITELSKGF